MKSIFTLFASFCLFSFAQAQTFTGTGGAISDNLDTTYYIIPVSGLSPANIDTAVFGLEQVCIDLTHTKDRDLDIFLESPDGTIVELTTDNGDLDDNYTNTCFRWDVSTFITAGTAPFTGAYKPEGLLPAINNGQNGNGNWRLRVYDDNNTGNNTGNMISWSITFGTSPAADFVFQSSNLPIIVINTGNQTIVDEPKIMADMGIIYNGPNIRNNMTDSFNNYNGKIGIEFRGSSSQGFPKKPYGIELWDVNGNAIDSSLLGMPKESDWILFASYSDKSLLNNALSYHLANQMGWYAPRTQHVELTINGQYMGVYVLMEKIKKDNNRVDIATLQPTEIFGDDVTGGYIIKIDKSTGNGGAGWTSTFAPDTAPNGQTIYFQYEYPSDLIIVPQQEAYIQAYVDSFETALAGPNFADTALGYARYMDVNSFIDYFLLNEMSRNVDGYRLSTYLYKDKMSNGGKLTIGPAWDYDLGWANADYCAGSDTTGWAYQFKNVCPGDYWQIPFWWDRLMQDPNFRDKVRCRWEELKMTVLSVSYLHNYADSMALYLDEGQQRNFNTWLILGNYVWPNPSPIPADYAGEITEIKNWMTARWAWMDANMPGILGTCNPTGMANEAPIENPLVAFPNPFQQDLSFSIYLEQSENVEVVLLNSLGQPVMAPQTRRANAGTQNITIDTGDGLAAGLYFLQIRAGNHYWTQTVTRLGQ